MRRRFWSILAAVALLTVGSVSCAEQVPSPTMPVSVPAQVTSSGSVEVKEDFTIQLVAETETVAAVLTEVQEFVETESVVKLFDEESIAVAAEYLPEDYNVENLMLAEVFALSVDNYEVDYGDVSATFEFAATYEDDAVLLGMVGIVNGGVSMVASDAVPEDSEGITWVPVPATVSEGRVTLTIAQELLEQISESEAAVFVLLQDQK